MTQDIGSHASHAFKIQPINDFKKKNDRLFLITESLHCHRRTMDICPVLEMAS